LLLSTIGIDTEAWDELHPRWALAIVFERSVRNSTTETVEFNNLVAIVERGHAVRYLR
jgi:hypothetical protein